MATKIVFFGSGPVAAKSLELLAKDPNFSIEAIVTKPKPPHHRGSFPVIDLSEKLKLKVYTTSNKQELSKLISDNPFASKLAVLIDFGIIVSQDVIDYFPLGIINSHFSLLPQWRGADPITFAILSDQKTTGVSLMLLTAGMDEGPLLAQTPFDIPDGYTTPQLTESLIELSAESLKQILPLYIEDKIQPADQASVTLSGSREPTYSRKLTKDDGILDFNKPAEVLEREIRGFIEWPKSRTQISGIDTIITRAHAVPSNDPELKPGDITALKEGVLMIECAKGYLCIDELKPAGKKAMPIKAFLAGYKINAA